MPCRRSATCEARAARRAPLRCPAVGPLLRLLDVEAPARREPRGKACKALRQNRFRSAACLPRALRSSKGRRRVCPLGGVMALGRPAGHPRKRGVPTVCRAWILLYAPRNGAPLRSPAARCIEYNRCDADRRYAVSRAARPFLGSSKSPRTHRSDAVGTRADGGSRSVVPAVFSRWFAPGFAGTRHGRAGPRRGRRGLLGARCGRVGARTIRSNAAP